MVAVGDKFPDVALQKGPFPPQEVNMPSRLAGKKTLVVGLPGAFTPTRSTCQVPVSRKTPPRLRDRRSACSA